MRLVDPPATTHGGKAREGLRTARAEFGVSCPTASLVDAPSTPGEGEAGRQGEGWAVAANSGLPAAPSE
jgi:hypothetical protein